MRVSFPLRWHANDGDEHMLSLALHGVLIEHEHDHAYTLLRLWYARSVTDGAHARAWMSKRYTQSRFAVIILFIPTVFV